MTTTTQRIQQRSAARYVAKMIASLLITGAILFGSAGSFSWRDGWLFFAIALAGSLSNLILLGIFQPELLAERGQMGENTQPWDRLLAPLVALVAPALIWLVGGLDARFSWLPAVPAWLQIASVALLIGGYLFTLWAMLANRFFAPVVRIQSERGHQVVSSGPYRWVRHPGYVGMLAYLIAAPFVLGSCWALIPAALAVALTVLRTALEDRALITGLDGYANYARRVRYRLLPGVW